MRGLYVKQGQDIMRDDAGIGPVKVAEVHAGHREERENLALLFGAAPDLYAACEAARALGTLGETHTHAEVRVMLDAALARATGEG